jgi:hypothetical protein
MPGPSMPRATAGAGVPVWQEAARVIPKGVTGPDFGILPNRPVGPAGTVLANAFYNAALRYSNVASYPMPPANMPVNLLRAWIGGIMRKPRGSS